MTGDRSFRVRVEARSAVARVAGTADPEPLAGIAAAALLAAEAERLLGEHARAAREDGAPWAAVAAALGSASACEAHLRVSRGFEYVTWMCASCRTLVRDYGPDLPPDEAERGHAAGCGRLAAAVAAWDAQQDEEAGNG